MKPRLWPRRLYPRLVLLIAVSVLSIFVITIAVLANERTRMFFLAQQSPVLDRIERLLTGMEPAPPRQRINFAQRMDAPNFRVELGVMGNTGQWGEEIPVDPGERERFEEAMRDTGREYQWQLRWFRSPTNPDQVVRMLASTTLSDGSPVSFSYPLPQAPVSLASAYLALGIALIAVMLFALLLGKKLLGPLLQLAEHARALGTSLEAPALEESGPEEVQAAARAMNHMQQRLLETERQRKQVLAAVSHDLKTPITRMLLRTEFMEDADLTAKFVRDLREMEGMINETLNFIKSHAANAPVQPVDMGALLKEVVTEFSDTGSAVTLVTIDDAAAASHGGSILVLARRELIKRCITNLLGNGIKYGNTVQCSISANTGLVELMFADAGQGVPEDQLTRVFDPFYRVDGSRNKNTGGHGLGLSICRQIALAYGGEVWLENIPSGGLRAHLKFPRAR